MLVLFSFIAADVPVDIAALRVIEPRVTIEQPAAPQRSPYRLDPNVTGPADGKAGALAMTGADCDRIGTVYCTTAPRKIYATSY